MNAVEKLRKLLTGKMPNGKTRSEACAQSHVGYALTIGDCAELLQEIDRLRALAEESEHDARQTALEAYASDKRSLQNRLGAEVEASERCVHCGVELEVEGDAGHCLSCTRGGQQS